MPSTQFISSETVISALRILSAFHLKRKGRTALMGFLLLKAKEPSIGASFKLESQGSESVEPELERFFRLAPNTGFPDVKPFGKSQGHLEFLAANYERRGTFTQLYPGRNLSAFVSAEQSDGAFTVKIPSTAAEAIAEELGAKIPARAAASFLMRNESFDANATPEDVVSRMQAAFHLTESEMASLFTKDADFPIKFSADRFKNVLSSLPSDLMPRAPDSHATMAEAADELEIVAADSKLELSISTAQTNRIANAVRFSKAVALVGPPGVAKSRIWESVFDKARQEPASFGFSKPPSYVCFTAEVDWTARTLIGGYYPQKGGELAFKEGLFLQAIRNNQVFWLEEMNRADLDRVLGPILTFLAGQSVDLGPTHLGEDSEINPVKQMTLAWVDDDQSQVKENNSQRIYCVGRDWRMFGTYNNVDRGRVFPMGSALLRRWAIVPIAPIGSNEFRKLLVSRGTRTPVTELLTTAYAAHLTALPIGPAPFLDIAKFVMSESEKANGDQLSSEERQSICDAYILYLGPQLSRLDPETREEFFKTLGGIFGQELASEAANF